MRDPNFNYIRADEARASERYHERLREAEGHRLANLALDRSRGPRRQLPGWLFQGQRALLRGARHLLRVRRRLVPGIILIAGLAILWCSPATTTEVEMRAPQHAATLIADRGETQWDLVALGDSTPAGVGVAQGHSFVHIYAGYLEEDLGVAVTVHNYATGGRRIVADWVEEVRRNEALRADLRNAEVVVLWLGSHDLLGAVGPGRGGPCYRRAGKADLGCLQSMSDGMREGFELLFAEIAGLANPADTVILAADVGIPPPMLRAWKEDGTLDVLKGLAYEVWREHLIQAAGRHGVQVVATYEALNGPHGDRETPSEYLQADRTHFNEQGHRLVADLYRGVGYAYGVPSRHRLAIGALRCWQRP